ELAEHLVADGVAVSVVHVFEVIDVEKCEREGHALTTGERDELLQKLYPMVAIRQPREGVRRSPLREQDVRFSELARALLELPFHSFASTDVAGDGGVVGERAVLSPVREHHLRYRDLCPFPIAVSALAVPHAIACNSREYLAEELLPGPIGSVV